MGWVQWAILVVSFVVGVRYFSTRNQAAAEAEAVRVAARESAIRAAYAGDEHLEAILAEEIAVGMTQAQVLAAWGEPDGVRSFMSGAVRVDVLGYVLVVGDEYAWTVRLEDGRVVEWTYT